MECGQTAFWNKSGRHQNTIHRVRRALGVSLKIMISGHSQLAAFWSRSLHVDAVKARDLCSRAPTSAGGYLALLQRKKTWPSADLHCPNFYRFPHSRQPLAINGSLSALSYHQNTCSYLRVHTCRASARARTTRVPRNFPWFLSS